MLRYLKGNLQLGLFYFLGANLIIQGYSDVDWASCVENRRSLTGYLIFLGPSLISGEKKPIISRSLSEAKHCTLATTTCELKWIRYLLQDLYIFITITIYSLL